MNNYCVYKHTSPSGKVYIGITCRKPTIRWGLRGQGYSGSKYLWKAIQKYGWESFKHEILHEHLSETEAKRFLISKYKSNEERYGYNITSGGDGAAGYKQTEEHIRKTSQKRKGTHHSEETRRKQSENNARYWQGKSRSEETRLKISQSLMGKKISPETITKRTETWRRNHPPKPPVEKHTRPYRKPVAQINIVNGEIIALFPSAREAEKQTGVRFQDIWCCANGRQKTAHGFKWSYAEEV